MRLCGWRGLSLISFVPESGGDFPRCLAESVRNIAIFPLVANARINPIVAVKLYIAEHARFGVNAIRHAALAILVRLQHVRFKAESEEPAESLYLLLRLSEELFKLHAVLSLTRDALEKFDDVLVA